MPPHMTIDVTGEVFGGPQEVIDAGCYRVAVVGCPEIKAGKESGKKYIEWILEVAEGEFKGTSLILRTTLDKGDNLKKSKRWLFSSTMQALGIEKVNGKYTLELVEGKSYLIDGLDGKQFFAKVIVKEEFYKGEPISKNEIKMVSDKPIKMEQPNADPVFKDAEKDEEQIPF